MAGTGNRRAPGEGSIYWDEKRQRFLAAITVGYTPAGKRIVRRGSGKTEAAARAKLKQVMRDYDDGLAGTPGLQKITVAHIVNDWLTYGLAGRAKATIDKCTYLCQTHILPALGARKLRELSATDVDRWLTDKAKTLSTRTLQELHQCLNRAVNRAMARDQVNRNVVALCAIPKGQPGRPSKSLTLDQAKAVLHAAESTRLWAYVVLSLLIGARTEELRALTWDHVDLNGQPDADPPLPPSIEVWRSVREGGDTKTRESRRTLALPGLCVDALHKHREQQRQDRKRAGDAWVDNDWSLPRPSAPSLSPATSAAPFERSSRQPGSTKPHGRLASSATASSRCSPTTACRSRRSPTWSATPAPRSPRRSTATNCARSCSAEQRSWTASSANR
jgi:integrase